LKDKIRARQVDGNGLAKLVIRPDSGDPVKIICGYTPVALTDGGMSKNWMAGWALDKGYDSFSFDGKTYDVKDGRELSPAEVKGVVECLWDIFGGTKTDKGFKQLDSHIGCIYGDSITLQRADDIMKGLIRKGFASGNVVFGVGLN
jgi:nicotinamide phosphoribosyltransferase